MFCPYCGNQIEGGNFCPHCGSSLAEVKARLSHPQPAPVAPEPVAAPAPAVEPEPTAAPAPAAAPEPVAAPAPVAAPEPIVAPAPAVEPEPVAAPAPVVEPEPIAAPAPVAAPEPAAAPAPQPTLTAEELLDPSASLRQPPEDYTRPEVPPAPPVYQPYPAQPPVTQEIPQPVESRLSGGTTREIPRPEQPTMAYRVPVKRPEPEQPPVSQAAQPAAVPDAAKPAQTASPVKVLAQVFGWIGFGLYIIVMLGLMGGSVGMSFTDPARYFSNFSGLFLPLALLLGMVLMLGSCLAIGKSRIMTLVGMLLSTGLLGVMTWYCYAQNWTLLVLLALCGGVLALVSGLIGVFARPKKSAVGVLVVIVVFAVLCLVCLAGWLFTGGAAGLIDLPVLFTW